MLVPGGNGGDAAVKMQALWNSQTLKKELHKYIELRSEIMSAVTVRQLALNEVKKREKTKHCVMAGDLEGTLLP